MQHDNYSPPADMQIIRNLKTLKDGLYLVYAKSLEEHSPCVVLKYENSTWYNTFPVEVALAGFDMGITGVIGPLPKKI